MPAVNHMITNAPTGSTQKSKSRHSAMEQDQGICKKHGARDVWVDVSDGCILLVAVRRGDV